MGQLLIHLWGDYILQSDWMAQNKTKESWPCAIHVALYSLPFLLLRPSCGAFVVIAGTHFLIDRFRLARYVVWAKNWMAPFGGDPPLWEQRMSWQACKGTGYVAEERNGPPSYMAVWLMIIADNILHLTINYLALRYL